MHAKTVERGIFLLTFLASIKYLSVFSGSFCAIKYICIYLVAIYMHDMYVTIGVHLSFELHHFCFIFVILLRNNLTDRFMQLS